MIAVTGATGFIGGHFIGALQARGIPFRALVHRSPLRAMKGGAPVCCDLLNYPEIPAAISGCDPVFHFASAYRRSDPSVDTAGMQNLIRACAESRVRRFVLLSSLDVISHPENPYSLVKQRAEEALKNSGLEYCIVRPSLVYGEHDHLVSPLIAWTRRSPLLFLTGEGSQARRPLYVDDLIARLMPLVDGESIPPTINIAGREVLSLREIAEAVAAGLKLRRRCLGVPEGVLKALGLFSGQARYLAANLTDKGQLPAGEQVIFGETLFRAGLERMLGQGSSQV